MKFLNTVTAVALIAAPAAWAGSVAEPAMEPMIVPVVAEPAPYDWRGFYAGLSAGKTTGNFEASDGELTLPFDLDGRSFGGYAGYNWQRGNLVYGLELALQDVDASLEISGLEVPEAHYNYMHDLKARLGYANDNMLFYAFAGYSMGEFEVEDPEEGGKFDANGPNLGLGVEMAFRENWLVGLEYIHRYVDGDFGPDFPEQTFDSDIDTIQLRVGYKF